MIITLVIFAVLNVVLAFIDAHKIIKGKWINHFLNAAVYIALVAVSHFIFKNYWLIASLLLLRLIVFNIMLSLFRGLSWDYISPDPKAITDKAAKFIFGDNGVVMYCVYGLLFITTLLIIFI